MASTKASRRRQRGASTPVTNSTTPELPVIHLPGPGSACGAEATVSDNDGAGRSSGETESTVSMAPDHAAADPGTLPLERPVEAAAAAEANAAAAADPPEREIPPPPEAGPPADGGDYAIHEALRPAPDEATRRIVRAAEPKPLRRRGFFSDMPDKGLFLAFAIIGFVVIFTTKSIGLSGLWAAGVAVVLLVTYAILAYWLDAYNGKPDSLGDNCYYMGFLFTLASLSAALIALTRDASSGRDDLLQALIGGFGVALFSTIVGILLRVIFIQMRPEIADLEEQLRNELQNSATLLKDQLANAVMDLENLRLRTRQVMDQNLEDASEGFTGVADALVAHVSAAGSAYREASERLAENAARVASEIGRLVDRVDQIQVPSDLLTRQVEDVRVRINGLAGALEVAAVSAGQRIEETRQRIDGIAAALDATAKAGSEKQEATNRATMALDAFVTRAADLSVFGNVAAVVSRLGDSVDVAVGKLSAVSERLEHYGAVVQNAAKQMDENGAAMSHARAVIADDLTQSTSALHKLQGALADVADGLVAHVTVGQPGSPAAAAKANAEA